MASTWDELDASTELEQAVAKELNAALDPRGFEVVHNGTSTIHAGRGKADIELRARDKSLLVLVELTKRKGAQAEGEFVSTTDHFDRAIQAGGFEQYGLLFAAPAVGARLRRNFLEFNRRRMDQQVPGRSFMLDFAGLEMLLDHMKEREPDVYPGNRLRALFADTVWPTATDDAQARQVAATEILSEQTDLILMLDEETRAQTARIEQDLKKSIKRLEDQLRDRGITGDNANRTLIFLTFMRLFEEKRVNDGIAVENRMSATGFTKFVAGQNASLQANHKGKFISYLLEVMRAEDPTIASAGLLGTDADPVRLHANVTDDLVRDLVFRVFDEYDFVGGRLDILGVIFEALARRAEKDTRVGQFFTPEEVVNFCADIVELKPNDRVLDPAVGTARFLIAAMERMLREASARGGDDVGELKRSIKENQLHGVDIDQWVASIAKMNMYIHGDGKSNIASGNGLILGDRGVLSDWPQGVSGAIDVVLTNPPLGDVNYQFAARDWEQSGQVADSSVGRYLRSLGVVPTHALEETEITRAEVRLEQIEDALDKLGPASLDTKSDTRKRNALKTRRARETEKLATLKGVLASGQGQIVASGKQMKGGALFLGAINQYLSTDASGRSAEPYEWRGGRVVIVLDEAILNTPAHSSTRAFLRENFFIKAVISLGRPAFKYLAHTDAKTSVVYAIKKANPVVKQQEPVFYSHAERVGYSATGSWIGSDLPRVAEQYDLYRKTVKAAYAGPILASDVLHTVRQIPNMGLDWYTRDVGEPSDRLDFFEARREELERALKESGVPTTTIGNLLSPRPMESPAASHNDEYPFVYIDRVTGMLRPKGVVRTQYGPGSLWTVREGDVVVSGIDVVHGAVAVARDSVSESVMSREMFPYVVNDPESLMAEYAALILRSPQTRAIIQGTVTGTSNRTRIGGPEELLDLVVPAPPSLTEQKAVVIEYNRSHDAFSESRIALQIAEAAVSGMWPMSAVVANDEFDDASGIASPSLEV